MTNLLFVKQYWKTVLASALILYLCFMPPSDLGVFPKIISFKGGDKIVHFVMFFALSVIMCWDNNRANALKNKQKRDFFFIFLFCFLFAVITELVQWRFIPNRNGDWLDLLADTLGIVTGIVLMKSVIFKRKV